MAVDVGWKRDVIRGCRKNILHSFDEGCCKVITGSASFMDEKGVEKCCETLHGLDSNIPHY